jgi:hypothetical protein
MRVDDAGSLEDTLSRLRQRYALYFYLPEGAKSGDQQNIRVDLAQEARIRYAQADVRYRHAPMSGNGATSASSGPMRVTHAPPVTESTSTMQDEPVTPGSSPTGRRVMVNEDSSPRVNLDSGSDDSSHQPSGNGSGSQPSTAGWSTTKPKPPE